MNAEVIAIGDELTSGVRLDTNSQWISRKLGDLGIRVLYHTTVGDSLEPCTDVCRTAIARADFVVCTGGLGPTADDLTRDAIAAANDVTLQLNEEALAHIRNLFERRGREMPERNARQAMFPAGSELIDNPHGTAPGIAMQVKRKGRSDCRLFALPGVPAELKEMWQATVESGIASALGTRGVIRHHTIKCFGVGESHLEAMMPDLISRQRDPTVGITVHEGTISLRVTARGNDEVHCNTLMAPTLATIRECCGDLIFGEEEQELEHAVLALLAARSARLATVESGTSGLMAEWLTEADPQHGVYLGGLVLPKNVSEHPFGPSSSTEAGHGGEENRTEELATRCRETFAADYALAIGARPEMVADRPTPRIAIALATTTGVRVESVPYLAHPAIRRPLAAKRALNLLRLELQK